MRASNRRVRWNFEFVEIDERGRKWKQHCNSLLRIRNMAAWAQKQHEIRTDKAEGVCNEMPAAVDAAGRGLSSRSLNKAKNLRLAHWGSGPDLLNQAGHI